MSRLEMTQNLRNRTVTSLGFIIYVPLTTAVFQGRCRKMMCECLQLSAKMCACVCLGVFVGVD